MIWNDMIWYEWMIRWIIGPGSTNPTAPSCSGHCLTHTAGLWASMFDGSKLREDASCEEVPWLMREFLGTEYGKNNAIYHPWLGMVYTPPIYGDLLGWLLLLFYTQLISMGDHPYGNLSTNDYFMRGISNGSMDGKAPGQTVGASASPYVCCA